MGEQPKPVEDEVERALASMRAGFLSGSEQIVAGVTALDEHLANAPGEEREAVQTAVARLLASHERIIAKLADLPPSSWDSFKVMIGAVKAQQAILDQVSHLVKEHVLSRQFKTLSATAFSPAPPEDEPPPFESAFPSPAVPDDGNPSDAGLRPDDRFPVGSGFPTGVALPHDEGLPASGGFRSDDGLRADSDAGLRNDPAAAFPSRTPPGGRRGRETGFRALTEAGLRTRADDDADDDVEPRSLLALLRERTAGFRGLAAMIVVGVILGLLPREKLQEYAAHLVELIGSGSSEVEAPDQPPHPSPDPPPTRLAAAAARSAERIAPSADAATATQELPEPATEVSSQPKRAPVSRETVAAAEDRSAPESAPPVQLAAAGAARTASQPAPARVTAAAVNASPAAPAAAAVQGQFVPVVFTHKDHATVVRALADMKDQFPNVLIGMQGEILAVDLGRKGTFHRLVLLPAGSRPQAAKVCSDLAAEGYDRCWVKPY